MRTNVWDSQDVIEQGEVVSKSGHHSLTAGLNCDCEPSDKLGRYRDIEVRIGDETYHILHSTVIAIVSDSGDVWLNNGGWETKITKDRINRALPSGYKLVQRDHNWYIQHEDQLFKYQNKRKLDELEKA